MLELTPRDVEDGTEFLARCRSDVVDSPGQRLDDVLGERCNTVSISPDDLHYCGSWCNSKTEEITSDCTCQQSAVAATIYNSTKMVRISRAAPRLTDPLNDIQFVSYVVNFLGMMSIKLRMAEGYAKKATYNMIPVHLCVEIVDERAQASGFFVLVSVQIAGEVLALDRKIPTPRQPAKVSRRA